MRRTDLYRVGGVRVPSVTEVLDIVGMNRFGHIAPEVLEAARLRGEEVHAWCDLLDKGDVSPGDAADESIQGYVDAYLKFKEESGFEVTQSECVVVSSQFLYAGTVDRIGYARKLREPHRPQVIDLKCVALVSPSARLQVAGYGLAVEDSTISHLRASLQLRSDGSYRLKQYDDSNDISDWLACVRVAHFKLRHGLAQLED